MLKRLIKPVASLFIVGEAIDDVIEKAKELNAEGFKVTMSPLAEHSKSLSQVVSAMVNYKYLIKYIAEEKIDASIAIKMSAFMPGCFDTSEYCLSSVLKKAKKHGVFTWIDMEGPGSISETLDIYKELAEEYDVGIALQTSMRRTMKDLVELPSGSNVRLCKGAYKAPKSMMYKSSCGIHRSFLRCLKIANYRHKFAVATHDNRLLDIIAAPVEFQFLYGVNFRKAKKMKNEGRRVLLYLPYGRNWYYYCLRRLKENPLLILSLLLKGMVSK